MSQFRYLKIGLFKRLKAGVLGLSALAWLIAGSQAWGQTISITNIVDSTADYPTFGSHNQTVVRNQHGIFISYLQSSSNGMATTHWLLKRSTDNGATFTTIDEDSTATSYPPLLETDRDGNVYQLRTESPDAYLRVYRASNGFAVPVTQTFVPNGHGQKMAMLLDEERQRIYYAVEVNVLAPTPPDDSPASLRFYVIGLNGTILRNVRLTYNGTNFDDDEHYYINSSYPQFALDERGDLYVAWMNAWTIPQGYNTHSMMVMRSPDGGSSFETLAGVPLTVPVRHEPSWGTWHNPLTMINDGDEVGDSPHLANMRVKEGKLHFPYRLGVHGVQRYVRYDTVTGQRDVNITGWTAQTSGGQPLAVDSQHAFCTTEKRADHLIYCVWAVKNENRLAVLVSSNNGQSWSEYASTGPLGAVPYYINGFREIRDGQIVGMFALEENPRKVRFFRVPVPPQPVTTLLSQNFKFFASSSATGYPPSNAIDGNSQTLWLANDYASIDNNNAWVMLDMQAVYEVDRVHWTGGQWTPYPALSPSDYTIAVSEDGRRWSTVATRTNPAGVINGSEPVRLNARYIKLTTTKVEDGSGWALAFHEFWVKGRPLPATCP
jgi:hypothetical protein